MSPERRRAIDFACYGFGLGVAFTAIMEAAGRDSWHWTATALVIADVAPLIFMIRRLPK